MFEKGPRPVPRSTFYRPSSRSSRAMSRDKACRTDCGFTRATSRTRRHAAPSDKGGRRNSIRTGWRGAERSAKTSSLGNECRKVGRVFYAWTALTGALVVGTFLAVHQNGPVACQPDPVSLSCGLIQCPCGGEAGGKETPTPSDDLGTLSASPPSPNAAHSDKHDRQFGIAGPFRQQPEHDLDGVRTLGTAVMGIALLRLWHGSRTPVNCGGLVGLNVSLG